MECTLSTKQIRDRLEEIELLLDYFVLNDVERRQALTSERRWLQDKLKEVVG